MRLEWDFTQRMNAARSSEVGWPIQSRVKVSDKLCCLHSHYHAWIFINDDNNERNLKWSGELDDFFGMGWWVGGWILHTRLCRFFRPPETALSTALSVNLFVPELFSILGIQTNVVLINEMFGLQPTDCMRQRWWIVISSSLVFFYIALSGSKFQTFGDKTLSFIHAR